MRDIANPYASLDKYLGIARGLGIEVVESPTPLAREYEAARFIKKHDGKAIVLFKLRDGGHIVAANLIPSRTALYKVLGAESDKEAYKRLSEAQAKPGSLVEEDFGAWFRREMGGAEKLPFLRFYEMDGGYYLTSAVFIACLHGVCNASIHRVMAAAREWGNIDYLAVRVVPRHLYRMLSESPQGLPVALVIGVDPRLHLASAMSPPYGFFELHAAARLLGGELRVCRTPIHGVPVPCGATMVVEARLGPERRPEGPFTDLLQLYDRRREEPVLHIEAVYRNKAGKTLHQILPGGMEHMLLMGFPREAAIYDAVAKVVPVVRKVRLTPGGGMWLHAVVSIEKLHDGDGKTAGFAAFAAHPSLKHVVVVDGDIDPDNPWEVEWAIATRLKADRGIVIVPYARGSTLDPSACDGIISKVIVDATITVDRECGVSKEAYRRPRIPGEEAG